MLKEITQKAEEVIKNSDLAFYTGKNYWIIFDTENNPYLGYQEDFFHKGRDQVISTGIYLFALTETLKKLERNERDAFISYEYSLLSPDKGGGLASIYVSQDLCHKGVGSQLLLPMELDFSRHNIKEITGVFAPMDYAKKTPESVMEFYRRNNYKPENKKAYIGLQKTLVKKEVQAMKRRTINLPSENYNFFVVLPEKLIVASHYADEKLR